MSFQCLLIFGLVEASQNVQGRSDQRSQDLGSTKLCWRFYLLAPPKSPFSSFFHFPFGGLRGRHLHQPQVTTQVVLSSEAEILCTSLRKL